MGAKKKERRHWFFFFFFNKALSSLHWYTSGTWIFLHIVIPSLFVIKQEEVNLGSGVQNSEG